MVINGGSGRSRVYWHLPLQTCLYKGLEEQWSFALFPGVPSCAAGGLRLCSLWPSLGVSSISIGNSSQIALGYSWRGKGFISTEFGWEREIYWLMTKGSRLIFRKEPQTLCSLNSAGPALKILICYIKGTWTSKGEETSLVASPCSCVPGGISLHLWVGLESSWDSFLFCKNSLLE